MIEKQNDYFLNLLNNPTFGADDFTLVGLSIDNTSILDKEVYQNSNYIKNLDVFKTNGEFDLAKFDNFYNYAKLGFIDLAKIKEAEDIGNTWMAYRNDISMPESLRDKRPQFKIEKVANPLRLQEGFVSLGVKEAPTQSIREIAETQLVKDWRTGELKESPNDSWLDNFWNPKVLATWDEDGTHVDPITGETVSHKKGERKLNENGTYYYETLGDRNIYGKEVLSGFDTLTTDGSAWNKLDFLDSDDLEKTTGGALMRTAALIVPAFIPGVNTWYIGARVGLGLSQILPAVGKTFESLTGIDTKNSLFNKLEAWDKALSFSQSDYVQGSLDDKGNVILDSHLWSMETGLKLIADVFTQLAELRWMFETATSKLAGLNKEIISSQEARKKWIEDYIKANTKAENIDEILLKGAAKGVDPRTLLATALNINWLRAQKVLEDKLKGAQELGSKLSMAYMTGITTASSYGEAKEAGASDVEAALFTLGYSFLEWKLLNSELGKWILPELKSEERHIKNVVAKAMPKIKEATNKADTKSEIGKATWYLKLFNLGKDAYNNKLGLGIGSEAIGSTISNMASEALEETSEELLLDISKTLFNAATSLTGSKAKFNDAFENVFDRYALSFLGGAVGGGIAGTLPAYRSAKRDRAITQEAATKEIVDLILLGKADLLVETVNKMSFGNQYLDENGNQVDDYTKSLDFQIKRNFARLVNDIKDILEVNGANLDKDSLLRELGPKDIRYGMFSALAGEKSNAIGWYLNRYNELSSLLVAKSLELQKLTDNKTDKEKREESGNNEKETQLKNEIKEIKEELDKFKDGTMSDEFILDALFEMTAKISGVYIPTLEEKIKLDTGKTIDLLSQSELKEYSDLFEASRPVRRDLIRIARQLHILNMEKLSDLITKYNENYFKNPDEIINNFNDVLFGHRETVIENPEEAVPTAEKFLAIYSNKINPLLYYFQQKILSTMEESKAKTLLDKIKSIIEAPNTLEKKLNIPVLPKTVEQLNALDNETKIKLFTALGMEDVRDLDEFQANYIEDVKDEAGNVTGQSLSALFTKDVNNWVKNTSIELARQFNEQLVLFLTDDNVKKEIISKLSSAKYMLPTVRLALTDFFTNNLRVPKMDEYGEPELDDEGDPIFSEINNKTIKEYLDSFKEVPNSPVDVYLDGIITSLKSQGVKISPLVTNINELVSKLARARNLDSFSYDDATEKTINEALDVLRFAEVGLDSAATTINGDLSDAFGFNVSINEIRNKRNDKKNTPLAEIPADVAELIKQDINRYKTDLLFFKSLLAYNNNQILNEHDKTYQLQSLNLYKKLKTFVGHLETPDWQDIDKLRDALNDEELVDLFDNLDKLGIDLESKDKLTKARLKIDKAIHAFFKANGGKLRGFKTREDRENAVKSLAKLLKDINITYSLKEETYTTVNIEEKSLPDKDFLWYLASLAAADPEAILNDYSDVISGQFAPIIGLEEAIRTTLSFLSDPKIFKLFADAYDLNLLEANNLDRMYLRVNTFRSIFIEGVPGSGKSSATLKTLTDVLSKRHPELLKNLVIVSNSKKNAKTLVKNLGMDPDKIQHFGIEEFRGKILNNYTPLKTDSNDILLVENNVDIEFDPESGMYKYKKFTLNPNGLDASMLIIDEATSLSQMDAQVIDKFMESKDIYGVYSGDFDQLGALGSFPIEDNKRVLITLDLTNYISTHKLGLIMRGNNTYKSNNTISLKINKYKFINSLMQNGAPIEIKFSYYMDNTGVYGDVVTKADRIDGKASIDTETKAVIANMMSTLKDGEKVNYIFDSIDSEMYKYLHENYADKINEISTKAAQSLEGLYYIVDLGFNSQLDRTGTKGWQEANNRFSTLYTAISRAKLATLIFDREANNGIISDRIKSTKINELVKSNVSQEARLSYANSRKTAIKRALENSDSHIKIDWKKENIKSTAPSEGEGDSNEEETSDTNTDVRNERKDPDIKNDGDSELNMMIHSFNTHENGGIIDENGQLILGERGTRIKDGKYIGERIDNANGIVKALGINVDENGKLSVEDTNRVLKILHSCRVAGLYEKTPNDVLSKLKTAFGTSKVSYRFIYRNRQKDPIGKSSRGSISKFFRGIGEKLMYLFNNSRNDKLETPPTGEFGLEIFVNGQQIEIPIGILTSPYTVINSMQGFDEIKQIFDTIPGGNHVRNLKTLHLELLNRKNNGESIPHLDSILKLLEITLWNYEHTTKQLNFVVRFNPDFVLNSGKFTGVQTPPKVRGEGYDEEGWNYKGQRLSLKSYRELMPNRKISDVYTNVSENVVGRNGIIIEKGIPFVLVSDYYSNLNDRDLYKKYIEQETSSGDYNPLITRVYVYSPTESLEYFLYNLQEQLKDDSSKTAKDLDTSIGNKLTVFRLLSFMLLDDSKFLTTYTNWLENNIKEGTTLQLTKSKNRLRRMLEIIKYLKDYESTLVANSSASTSKQLLQFLDKSIESIKTDHSPLYDLFKLTANLHVIGNTKWSIRTALLWEFRKLLLSSNYYEDANSAPPLSITNSHIIEKVGDDYNLKPHQKERIDALKEDLARNNWDEIMFHTSLEKNSEITTNDSNGNVHRIARINSEDGIYISARSIEINGKLDSTAVITNVEPIMDEILSKLVLNKEGSVCSNVTSRLSADTKKKLYNENTGGFLEGNNPDYTESIEDKKNRLFNNVINLLSSDLDIPQEDIKNAINTFINNDEEFETYLNNAPGVLRNSFDRNKFAILLLSDGKYKITPLPDGSTKLLETNSEVYYTDGEYIYTASNKLLVTDPKVIESLLNSVPRSWQAFVLLYLDERLAPPSDGNDLITGLQLMDTIFGEGFLDFAGIVDFSEDASNESNLVQYGALTQADNTDKNSKQVINELNLLGAYYLHTVAKLAQANKFDISLIPAEVMNPNIQLTGAEILDKFGITPDKTVLDALLQLIVNAITTKGRFDCIKHSK